MQAETLRVTRVRDGVRYLFAWDRAGPWAIHVLEIGRPCTPVWQARKGGPPLADRATTTALSFGAMNADFFALPLGVPVGAQVSGSEVLVGPADRPFAVGFTRDGHWIDAVRLEARLQGRRLNAPVVQVNRPHPAEAPPAVRLFTHWLAQARPGIHWCSRRASACSHPAAAWSN